MSVLPPSSATRMMSRSEVAAASREKLLAVWTSVLLANNLLEKRGEKVFAFTEPAEVSEGEEGAWEVWGEGSEMKEGWMDEDEKNEWMGDMVRNEESDYMKKEERDPNKNEDTMKNDDNILRKGQRERIIYRTNDVDISREDEATRPCQTPCQT